MGGVTSGIPVDQIQAGKRFSPEYNPIEKELSRKVGDRLQFNVSLQLMAA